MPSYVELTPFKLLCGHNDCTYAYILDGSGRYCNYLEVEGHKRPCKPTQDCSCYKSGKNKRIVHHIHLLREEN